MKPDANNVINLAEFLKAKAREQQDMKPQEIQLAEVGIDAIANAIIGLINVENHLDRIATALEEQGRMMKRMYNLTDEETSRANG